MLLAYALLAKRDDLKQLGNAHSSRHKDGAAFRKYLAFLTSKDYFWELQGRAQYITSPYESQEVPLPSPAAAGVLRSQSRTVTARC